MHRLGETKPLAPIRACSFMLQFREVQRHDRQQLEVNISFLPAT
ncbi:hypothetical protein HMPREF9575_02380 [Cutibacterium acnes HL110PA1]|nr:hypothetical protein HMPREF9567_01546 [Cutibacterium acnes HL013PA1]EFS39855.1 hypothetical protein HMPREF9575_02380 [Cutibacterium acnes HL110PA1]EFS43404.1 hypothetical protein HMPREF9576_01456 [Cutibacterium acnes HL110PA2]EFS68415.1 hypothetical protein HMPREF9616_01808 [Cutibacterium acnes HL007PA1]EGE94511.1 hypothetical protein HMPREF9570_00689 [Cutibacterium acnes HL043PA1]EGF00290.1 hypothetical protein HMPREF9586_01592 [Cutibacterium acnes HL083PA2]